MILWTTGEAGAGGMPGSGAGGASGNPSERVVRRRGRGEKENERAEPSFSGSVRTSAGFFSHEFLPFSCLFFLFLFSFLFISVLSFHMKYVHGVLENVLFI